MTNRQGAKKSWYPERAGDGFDAWRLGVLAVHSAATTGIAGDRVALGRWRLGEPVKQFPNAIPLHFPCNPLLNL
jgi:hypothetical protein